MSSAMPYPSTLYSLYDGYQKKGLEESISLMKAPSRFADAFKAVSNSAEFDQIANQVEGIIKCSRDNAMAVALFSYAYQSYNINFREEISNALLSPDQSAARELATLILNLVQGMRKIRTFLNQGTYMFAISIDKMPQLRGALREGFTFEYPSFIVAHQYDGISSIVPDGTKVTAVITNSFHGAPISKINQNSNEIFIQPGAIITITKCEQEYGVTKIFVTISQDTSVFDGLMDAPQTPLGKSSVQIQNDKFAADNSQEGALGGLDTTFPFEQRAQQLKYIGLLKAIENADFCDYNMTSSDEERTKKIHDHAVDLQSRCKETLAYLKKRGVLEKYGMTEEEAMAIIIFTFDYGTGKKELNPYLKINKALGERNSKAVQYLPFILHLLNALRKLQPYRGSTTLYRGVKGINIGSYKVGRVKTWPAFTSTCADRDFAEDFASGQSDVLFIIKGDFVGYEIQDFSIFNEEGK